VKAHPTVREVLLSGGDPFLLSDNRLLRLVRAFARLPQIDAVRIGTRAPVTLPMRVTETLARRLGAFKNVWVNTQFNHARELTPEAVTACGRLVDAGIPVSNQSVLLRGVNDSTAGWPRSAPRFSAPGSGPTMCSCGDPVAGIPHFRVALRRARRIERNWASAWAGWRCRVSWPICRARTARYRSRMFRFRACRRGTHEI
jgi:lysine 2,3-aminomutase